MKTFILDDEPKIRRGLSHIVTNYHPDRPAPLTAASAEEALENPGLLETDILFLDIRLPGMSGLDFLRILSNEKKIDPQVIIVSGYENFTYAQQSLQLRAKDYLVKPVNIRKLYKILDDAEKEAQEKYNQLRDLRFIDTNLRNLRTGFFASVLSGAYPSNPEQYEECFHTLKLNNKAFWVLLFQDDDSVHNESERTIDDPSFSNDLRNSLSKDIDLYLIDHSNKKVAIFIWGKNDEINIEQNILKVKDISTNHAIKTGTSAIHYSFLELHTAFQEALKELKEYDRHNNIILPYDKTNYIESILKGQNSYSAIVRKALQYIIQNSSYQFKIEQIASVVYIHSNYLSELFKKETGKNLSTFITDYRLYQAKKKLQILENKVYMVAEQVGFSDPHYFSMVFKKRVGVTPYKYRNMAFKTNQ
ncbi:MAG TPA: response regulator [Clostridiaceae bacterium]|nr:response regulator [Clostridiaceae bacterium]